MNTYRYISLHFDTLYGTILECIQHGKDGQRVSYGRQAAFSKGGCTSVRSLTRDGQAVVAAQDCTRRQTWQAMAYQAKHARQPQGARNATREVVHSLAISPVAPSVLPDCFQHASNTPLGDATCLHFTHAATGASRVAACSL